MVAVAANFAGSIPEHYDRCLGPAYFGPFAAELARRVAADCPGDVLEIACGTGLVTHHLRPRLPPAAKRLATDLSAAMIDGLRTSADRPGAQGA